ncbi:MAG: hypothetical protein KKC79_21200 [Gammaproteobacteria bacterium]|nr:hypothetical protein [Gammaproteobacteria bacterium]MBU1440997.1 hypothetical protein [Gammaproteobacteria bacterium]MBU2285038.1 hypothetical protein [Gammaproteobacteria bacterium]MBU2411156.1 hypothetical protein [Gammaproteobacteria bacterium]
MSEVKRHDTGARACATSERVIFHDLSKRVHWLLTGEGYIRRERGEVVKILPSVDDAVFIAERTFE